MGDNTAIDKGPSSIRLDREEISVKGKMVGFDAIEIGSVKYVVKGKFLKTAMVREEWDEDVTALQAVINTLKRSGVRVDIFTFVQRLPDSRPKYDYFMEWDNVAAIPIKTYEYWLANQITKQSRNRIKKAQKTGVDIRQIFFDKELVRGISDIYNEVPIKQERKNKYYGMDLETVRRLNSTFLDRADFIGAYYQGELIGYIKVVYTDRYARTMGILGKEHHRDKSPMNLLLAKAVEMCAEKKVPFLTYAKYDYGKLGSDSLQEFKKFNGFENILIPRYYIPITLYGQLMLSLGFHKGIKNILPQRLAKYLRRARKVLYSLKYSKSKDSKQN